MWNCIIRQRDKKLVSCLTSRLVKVPAQWQDVHSCPQVGSAAVWRWGEMQLDRLALVDQMLILDFSEWLLHRLHLSLLCPETVTCHGLLGNSSPLSLWWCGSDISIAQNSVPSLILQMHSALKSTRSTSYEELLDFAYLDWTHLSDAIGNSNILMWSRQSKKLPAWI